MSDITPRDFFSLCSCLRNGQMVRFGDYLGIILSIERADGSGNCFNVKLVVNYLTEGEINRVVTVFVQFEGEAKAISVHAT
jgi:hypothetical protein